MNCRNEASFMTVSRTAVLRGVSACTRKQQRGRKYTKGFVTFGELTVKERVLRSSYATGVLENGDKRPGGRTSRRLESGQQLTAGESKDGTEETNPTNDGDQLERECGSCMLAKGSQRRYLPTPRQSAPESQAQAFPTRTPNRLLKRADKTIC